MLPKDLPLMLLRGLTAVPLSNKCKKEAVFLANVLEYSLFQ